MLHGAVSGVTRRCDPKRLRLSIIPREWFLNAIVKQQVLRFAVEDESSKLLSITVGTPDYRADLKIANTAPCGSAITARRPTPSIVIGARHSLAPSPFALDAQESTSSTWK